MDGLMDQDFLEEIIPPVHVKIFFLCFKCNRQSATIVHKQAF